VVSAATVRPLPYLRKCATLRIPAAITNGETLHAWQRQVIGCRVFDQYGSVELAAFAAECGCGTMHVSPDYGKVEIVDDGGRPVPAGEVDHLVSTGLINQAQILVRYRIGDVAAWRQEPCPCGSPLPALERLEGRASHAFVADGRRVYRVGVIAENIPRIRECRIVQESIGKFTIEVVAAPGFRQADAEELTRNLTANVGPASIRVALVDHIERGPGGKFAFLVSRIEACQPAARTAPLSST
jgi:phenylacetate-CoA ligase